MVFIVVTLQVQPLMETFSRHMQCVLTVYVTSFANLGTVGILRGTFNGIVDKEKNELILRNVKYMIISGISAIFSAVNLLKFLIQTD